MTTSGNWYQCYISMWTTDIAVSLALSEAAVERPKHGLNILCYLMVPPRGHTRVLAPDEPLTELVGIY